MSDPNRPDGGGEMLLRQSVMRQTMLRFRRRPFKYGSGDCIAMLGFHLVKAGVPVPVLPQYRSLVGAVRALKRRGFDTVEQLVGSLGLDPIAPAMMRLGDVATIGGHDGLSSAVIAEGQMVFGYHEDALADGATMIVPYEFSSAWRVPFGVAR